VDEAPDPPDSTTYEALFEVPAHELKEQAAPLYEVLQKEGSGDSGWYH
jgi:hypothetical protein